MSARVLRAAAVLLAAALVPACSEGPTGVEAEFVVSVVGDTFVMRAGPTFEVLGRNSLGEMTLASPAIANGSVIMRTASKLYRIARTQ